MSNKGLTNDTGGAEVGEDKKKMTWGDLEPKLRPGDTTWVKVRGFPWWPAQVVSENSVSKECKPRKRTKTAVLVRLYGSYEYVFMDPAKTLPESDKVLERHKGSPYSIIEKALSQVVPEVVSRSSKKEKPSDGGIEKQRLENNEEPEEKSMLKKAKTDNDVPMSESPKHQETPKHRETPKHSARRMKVMQGLGLMAPSGSPFYKN